MRSLVHRPQAAKCARATWRILTIVRLLRCLVLVAPIAALVGCGTQVHNSATNIAVPKSAQKLPAPATIPFPANRSPNLPSPTQREFRAQVSAPSPPAKASRSADVGESITLSDGTKLELEQWGETYEAYEYRPPLNSDDGKIVKELDPGSGFLLSQIVLDSENGIIYWIGTGGRGGSGALGRINVDGTNDIILRKNIDSPCDLAIDTIHKKVYWAGSDPKPALGHTIRRANLDGSAEEDLVSGLLAVTVEIGLDVHRGKMYYTDHKCIVRANLDGTNEEDFVVGAQRLQGQPFRVGVDPIHGRVYWQCNFDDGRVARANWVLKSVDFDGADPKTSFVEIDGAGDAESITVDAVNNKLYWGDNFSVCRANFDGTQQERLIQFRGGGSVARDPAYPKIYWTADNSHKILAADLPSLLKPTILPAPPRIDEMVPSTAGTGERIKLLGRGFTGTTTAAFIDNANGRHIKAKFEVESDDRLIVTVPDLSDRCNRAAIVVLSDCGLTVTYPLDTTVVTKSESPARSSADRRFAFFVRPSGRLRNLEQRLAYVEPRGTFRPGTRGGCTVFLKDNSVLPLGDGQSTGNIIYHEPFAQLYAFGDVREKNDFIPVPAIRASFVPTLFEFKKSNVR